MFSCYGNKPVRYADIYSLWLNCSECEAFKACQIKLQSHFAVCVFQYFIFFRNTALNTLICLCSNFLLYK